MDGLAKLEGEDLVRRMRQDFEDTIRQVADAVNDAPDGHLIDGSEERVRGAARRARSLDAGPAGGPDGEAELRVKAVGRHGGAGSQKNEIKPWLKEQWCVPPDASGEFVWRMEDVLDVYQRPHDPARPVVALDEKPVQLLGDTRERIPCKPGEAAKQDHEYKRNGTANIFCAFEPLGNWRRLAVTERRTKWDFAAFVKELIDGRYKNARKVVLVMDNLNTHTPASFYDAFTAGVHAFGVKLR